MSGGYGPPILDFSPLGNLVETFSRAQDSTRKRRLEDLQLQGGDEWARLQAEGLNAGPTAPVVPSAPSSPDLASIPAPQPKAPTFAAMEGATPSATGAGMAANAGNRAQEAMAYLTGQGWTPAQAAGIVGNLQAESGKGLKTDAIGDNGSAFGIAQWRLDRREALNDFARQQRRNPADFMTQVAFLNSELNGSEKFAGDAIRSSNSPDRAAIAMIHALRPAGYTRDNPAGGHNARVRAANALALAGGSSADLPAAGAQNTQFQIPGQAQQPRAASAPVSSQPPQLEMPAFIRQGLQSQNPYVRQKAAEVAQKYIAQRQEMAAKQWELQEREAGRRRVEQERQNFERPYKDGELDVSRGRLDIDRERLDLDRNKPMGLSPEQDVYVNGQRVSEGRQRPIQVGDALIDPVTRQPIYQAPQRPIQVGDALIDPVTRQPIYQAPQKRNVKSVVENGRVIYIDEDKGSASDITPQGMPSGYRPLTLQEKRDYGIPENTGAAMGPDGKPYTLAGTASTRVSVGGDESPTRKKLSEKEGERWNSIQATAMTSGALTQDFQVLDELMKVAPQGPIVGQLAQAFPGVSSAGAAFQSVIKRVAPSLRTEGSGATSDIEYEGMLQSLPSLGNRPEANRMIADTMKAKAELNIQRGAIITRYQNNEIDEGAARRELDALNKVSIMSPELRQLIQASGSAAAPGFRRDAPPATPRVGDLRDGYRFKGGNPADPSSWHKVQ